MQRKSTVKLFRKGAMCFALLACGAPATAQNPSAFPQPAFPQPAFPQPAFPQSAMAQSSGGATAFANQSSGLKLLLVEENTVSELRSLGLGSEVQAVSLGASLAVLQRDAFAATALDLWVRGGGTVFLHTDAAQLFGYFTTRARETTNARAGQLFGRARSALPFGANWLLWSTRRETIESGNSLQSAFSAPAVRTVFYEMQSGDDLVVSHPAATPLLRVFDVAGDDTALYAAAIAPYGRGWAVFTPRRIEQDRADGAAFAQNLLRLAAGTPRVLANAAGSDFATMNGVASSRTPPQWLSFPAAILETLSAQAAEEGFDAAAWVSALLPLTFEPSLAPQTPGAFGDEKSVAPYQLGLMIERRELDALLQLLNAARLGDASASTRARALIFVWRARLEMQRDDGRAARAWIDEASGEIPLAAETLFWQGVVAWNEGEADDPKIRSRAFEIAAQAWRQSPAAPTLGSATGATRTISLAWAAGATQAARLAEATPDYAAENASGFTFYSDGNADTRRYFSAQTANFESLSRALGWRADSPSLVAFATLGEYSRFRSALGLPPQNIAVDGAGNAANRSVFAPRVLGDVVGTTLLTVAPRSARQGNANVPPQSLVPPSQLLVRALLNTLLQDGKAPPRWMELGLLVLADRESAAGAQTPLVSRDGRTLRDLSRGNRLLTAEQFESDSAAENGVLVFEQARAMMAFFYRRYGAGRVVETLQRIASGQNVDDAFEAATGLNQGQFFRAWNRAEFGGR